MAIIQKIGSGYLSEFYDYYSINNISEKENIKNKIEYYFGVEKKYLTKSILNNKNKFIRTVLNHSKPSELERDIQYEFLDLFDTQDALEEC